MPGMVVHLDRAPHSAHLVAWGRDAEAWWACVTWRQRVTADGGDDEIPFAAWVPATAVSQPGWANTVDVPRLTLPTDRTRWPSPPGWPYWYAGVWIDGPPIAPAGLELVTGAAWRKRVR